MPEVHDLLVQLEADLAAVKTQTEAAATALLAGEQVDAADMKLLHNAVVEAHALVYAQVQPPQGNPVPDTGEGATPAATTPDPAAASDSAASDSAASDSAASDSAASDSAASTDSPTWASDTPSTSATGT